MCPSLGYSLRALYVFNMINFVSKWSSARETARSQGSQKGLLHFVLAGVSDILAVSVLETARTEWQRLRKQQLGFVSSTYVVHDRHRSLCLELLQCYI